MTQQIQNLVLDGATYALASLPQSAIDTLGALRFVEARLGRLHDEMAVNRTAHVAYARALKAELDQMASPLLFVTPSQ
ncbi:MAG: hypothetical protein IKE14_13735 [Loktanella sp.]|nr:hypothetical protein [Loktanella sp.]